MSAIAPDRTGSRPQSTAAEVVVASSAARDPEKPVARRALVLRVFLIGLAVAVVVSVGGGLVARWLAESEAVRDAAVRTDDIAEDIVAPALHDGVTSGDAAALRLLDDRIRVSVIGHEIARVKVWSADGTIVYSDEPRLIGAHFGIDEEEREALETGGTHAEISDLDEPENRYERGDGPLLEVYRAIHTPDGTPLLFEVYYRYDDVLTSAGRIWFGFAVVIPIALLLLLLALLPVLNGLVRKVERAREEREVSLLKALDASDAERRRIAATVHDGPVQDLIGAGYRLGAASYGVRGTELEPVIGAAETAVRDAVDGLRGMLVDLYPAALADDGLATALGDHVAGLRARGVIVVLRLDDDLQLTPDAQRLVFRIARETAGNAVKHGGGTPVRVEIRSDAGGAVLTVADAGAGFDAAGTIANPPAGHFGMRLLQDAVRDSGVDATLTVRSGADGTTWRLAVR